ncbi:uncharacterized protein BDR25DRAFT_346921 [Lindgomyces ingoldianus]|uniref:Uncharacterized protein n=1 Tax=Lindgomyces ingoldianus TaxID=673940 RepID=A0ACB6QAV1_9PLEO|nr:uncharacterized protein BDR25DRAFT_346921 [Lindgomyces ingoldianus]KAF2464010.1 hypothetical protein BDR25DRAFT_346921 [Lindgomyces ingoldianus]
MKEQFTVMIPLMLCLIGLTKAGLFKPTPTTEDLTTIEIRKRVARATIPSCTWEGHCLGDSCVRDDDCDHGWVCVRGICALNSGGDTTMPTIKPSSPFPTATVITLVTSVVTESRADPNASSSASLNEAKSVATSTESISLKTASPNPIKHGLSEEAKIGIGIGIPILAIIVISLLICTLLYQRKLRKVSAREDIDAGPEARHSDPKQDRVQYVREPYKYQMVENGSREYGHVHAAELEADLREERPAELPERA